MEDGKGEHPAFTRLLMVTPSLLKCYSTAEYTLHVEKQLVPISRI